MRGSYFITGFLFFFLSATCAFAKKAIIENEQKLIEESDALRKKGELDQAKSILQGIMKKYGDRDLSEEEVSFYNSHSVNNIKTLSNFIDIKIRFIDEEIKGGKQRKYPTQDKLWSEIREALINRNFQKLEKMAWVEMNVGACESDADQLLPEKFAKHLEKFLPSVVKIKDYEKVVNSNVAVYKFSFDKKMIYEVRFHKYNNSWIWDWFVYCAIIPQV